jgi:response regulator RpfG family c-di-GMP phosphodiesterase
MPKIAGDEVCRRVKSEPESAFLPVVLVTAYDERGSRSKAIEAQADDLLISPLHRAELVARVRSLLRLRLYHDDLVRHESVVRSLSAALEAKDAYTRGAAEGRRALRAAGARARRTAGGRRAAAPGRSAPRHRQVAILSAAPCRAGSKHEFAKIMEHPVIG